MKKSSIFYTVSKIVFHFTFVMFTLSLVVGGILLGNASIINSALGIQTSIGSDFEEGNLYFDTKYENLSQVREASLKIIEETMAEGAVLLKNDADGDGETALPLSEGDSVNLYGAASYYSVHNGQGSSGNDAGALDDRVTFFEGLSNAGLVVNSSLNEWYKTNSASSSSLGGDVTRFIGSGSQQTQYVVKDVAWNNIGAAKTNAADAAIMVLARNSGEALDLYMDTTMDDNSTRVIVSKENNNNPAGSVGDALELSDNEKDVLRNLKLLKGQNVISKIIVIMNSASQLQCEFLEDDEYDIDSCLWVGAIGTNGADAIGKLLTGKYNPSGRASDTFWANSKYNPVYYNVGSIQYGNSNILGNYGATLNMVNVHYYVAYQEGIYNGYKYTETRYEDYLMGRPNTGAFDYENAVSYPFGYGLSYSSFTYSNMSVTENPDDTYTVTVDVKNETDVPGKEAVQVYLQKPYTEKDIANGVEKAAVELIGFDKVDVPANGTVTAEIKVKGKYFAAYDANGEKTFVIGSVNANDEYLLTAAKDAHDAVNNILQYKDKKGLTVNKSGITVNDGRSEGDSELVWGKYFPYSAVKYSTNDFIESENQNFTPQYEGQQPNYGVDKITNQFEDVDFKKSHIFTEQEKGQVYLTRNNWAGTYGKRILLTANQSLKEAQKNPYVYTDNIPYPTYGEIGFYEDDNTFDEIKLIYLRGKDYDDPLWDTLLNRMTWAETCYMLQDAFRKTEGAESIAAPSSSQQNGAVAPLHARTFQSLPSQSGFRGFTELLDPTKVDQIPPVFVCNGIVAATFNTELILRLGEQTGEEGAWSGYNGIYGLGVNIHRGAYCGRTFEYYSEDGFLTGVAAGYEAVGMHKLGVFVLAKHAILNDQETHRSGLNVWANEQSIREIYSRALEVVIEIDREHTPNTIFGIMTGMNRMGAIWTGGQGFINTVLRAEYGMRAYAISDYNSSRPYMSPIQGVLYGCDLPDGNPAGNRSGYDYDGNDIRFTSYEKGYGKLAWAMRAAVKNVLYTIVNSNTMNGVTGDSYFKVITPDWEKMIPVVTRVLGTMFVWSTAAFALFWIINFSKDIVKNKKGNVSPELN